MEWEPTGKFVVYLLATLLPDWQPPAPDSRKAIFGNMVPALREAKANGKSLRELANEVGHRVQYAELLSLPSP